MPRNNLAPNAAGLFAITSAIAKKGESFLLDLQRQNADVLSLKIDGNIEVDLLILAGKKKQKLLFDFGEYVTLKLQVLIEGDNKNLDLVGTLKSGVHIEAALADFSSGKGKVNIEFTLSGRGSHLEWHTASLASNQDEKIYSVNFLHTQLDTYASMSNFGVTEDQSKLQFTGTGHIVKGAKNSKTHQEAKIMVFDPLCIGRADPVLKIDENEVEASHAATVGKINDEHLFYLSSRGLSKDEAKKLITLGYLKPILEFFTDEPLRVRLADSIERGI